MTLPSRYLTHAGPQILRTWALLDLEIEESLNGSGSSMPAHDHENAFLALNLAGGFMETEGQRTTEYGPGSASFHPRDHRHGISIGRRDVRCLTVDVAGSWMERLAEIGVQPRDVLRDHGGPLVWLTTRLYEELGASAAWSPLVIEGLILEILGVVAQENHRKSEQRAPRWMTMIEQVIREEYAGHLSVSGLAARAGVHPVHLSRTWRRLRGCSVADSIHGVRVERACEQITGGGRSLAEIALDVGFSDQTHFSRVFKRLTGTTPGAFRAAFTVRRAGTP